MLRVPRGPGHGRRVPGTLRPGASASTRLTCWPAWWSRRPSSYRSACGYLRVARPPALRGLLGRPAPAARAPSVVLLGLVCVGVPLATAGTSSSPVVTAALFALSGLFSGPVFGALLVTRDRQAPPELRSQVFALGAGAKITASAAGAALAGALAGLPGALQLLVAGGWPVIAGGVGLGLLRPSVSRRAR
jgi:hypothetical protein